MTTASNNSADAPLPEEPMAGQCGMKLASHVPASSVTRALNIVGDRWTIFILREAFLGVRRFDQWQTRLGIARSILANRLKRLVDAGCLRKIRYQERPTRYEYRLTPMGLDLYAFALMTWRFENRWGGSRRVGPVRLIDRTSGGAVLPKMICRNCRQGLDPREVRYVEGPGAGYEPKAPPRLHRRPSAKAAQTQHGAALFSVVADILSDRWTYLVVALPYFGIHRFDEMRRELKIATNILADRLKHLTRAGLLERRLYQHRPKRYKYVLTEQGRDLYPLILSLLKWGDRWLAGDAGVPLILYHKSCGAQLDPIVVCETCDTELDAHNLSFELDGN